MLTSPHGDRSAPGAFVPFERTQVEQSVPRRFAWQVERHTSRLAVRIGGASMTYETLDRLSSRIAHGLLDALGPGEAPVALLFGPDVTHVATQLGVLKAGKICVPMDAAYPPGRLSTILADADARVLLTDRAHHDQATELCRRIPGVEPSDVQAWAASAPDRDPGLDISPSAIAYVFYTSGSTGEPKGVMQTHRNLLQTVRLYGNAVELRPSDRVFCPMPLAYAGGVWGLLASLLNGGAFCRGGADVQADVAGQLIREEITVAQLMVSMLRNLMLSASGEERFPKLRQVFTGGEVLYVADVTRFQTVFPAGCSLLYDLGSTEAGFVSFYRPVPRPPAAHVGSAPAEAQPVPAGYPATDLDVLLLDENLTPVLDGAVGQMAVRGEFISPGYWRNPERTEARFFADPAGSGRRIYLTGDLGRRLEDGCLLHLGRADLETKILGHRVAVEEIERALRGVPAITDAAVSSWTDAQGDAHLVAYVACRDGASPTVTQLRRHLVTSLPAHMVPTRFVFVDTLPLLPTGKVDRAALRPPEGVRPPLDVPFVPPRTPFESLLAGMWVELLGVDRVGALDGFLDLGGNSLLAARLVARLWDRLQVAVPVLEVFEARSLAELSLRVLELTAASGSSSEKLFDPSGPIFNRSTGPTR